MKKIIIIISIILTSFKLDDSEKFLFSKFEDDKLYEAVKCNLTVFHTLRYYNECMKKPNYYLLYNLKNINRFPMGGKNWDMDIKLKINHDFDSITNNSFKIISWYWQGYTNPSSNLVKVATGYTLCSQLGCLAYNKNQEPQIYYLGGQYFTDNNLNGVFNKKSLQSDTNFTTKFIKLLRYNYLPDSINITKLNDTMAIYSFRSKDNYFKYKDTVIYNNESVKMGNVSILSIPKRKR